MLNASPKNLHKWITRITDNEMPIFGKTLKEIMSVSEDNVSSASQLGQVVLKDAAMTSRILKLANSAYYNSSGHKFNTISRAIMMLGFNTVRDMCLTVSLIDSLGQGIHRKHVIQEMARSLHAATQAKNIAIQREDPASEEVFIATLLYHIGDLAFWCFAHEIGEQLHSKLQQENKSPAQAQRDVLGFTFLELSQGLAHIWSLSDMLEQTLQHPNNLDSQNQTITLSHQLAIAVEQGWESGTTNQITEKIAKLIDLPIDETISQLHEEAKKAATTSRFLGANTITQVIPLPETLRLEEAEPDDDLAEAFIQPNPSLQLQILRELTSLHQEKVDFSVIIEITLEAIHRGIGIDNVLFAVLFPSKKGLHCKQAIGNNQKVLQERFDFNFTERAGDIWKKIIQSKQTLWVKETVVQKLNSTIPASLESVIKTQNFYAAPVFINSKVIGLFYADQSASGRQLDQESYDSFTLFTQQAVILLNNLLSDR